MQIVTFTTDMGQSDYYLGALKGALFTRCIDIQIVDVAVRIPPFKLRQAAHVLRHAYPYYPKGTIHVMNVNSPESKGRMLCVQHHEQYFIFFDNGAITLLFDSVPSETYLINEDVSDSSNMLFAEGISNIINAITSGLGLAIIGNKIQQVRSQRTMIPQYSSGFIKGTVIYFDEYGNAVTNITRPIYDQCIGDGKLKIEFGIYEINKLCRHYGEVDEGELLALFNAEEKLEIALNKYNASKMLSLKLDTSSILVQKIV